MARSPIQCRQDARRERNEAYDATLRQVSTAARPPPDCRKALREAHAGLGGAVRDPAAWRPKLKTRDPGRLRLAAARHLFALYPVSAALERVWLSADGLDAEESLMRKRWYAVAAGGGSLWKAGASQWLSRKEVHRLVHAPEPLGFEEAFWHAVACSFTEDAGLALRLARSKIASTPRAAFPFWREALRFFCANPLPAEGIDDLCDFLAARLAEDAGFSLKGRTLPALRRGMAEWHHDQAAIRRIELRRRAARQAALWRGETLPDDGWKGSPLQDWSWQGPPARGGGVAGGAKETFRAVQLKTAADLVAESRAMRHCVWSYADKCIAGHASIWSLRRSAGGSRDRLLTVELDRNNRAVQIRGFSNRLADAGESRVLARWFTARGIVLP